MNIPNKEDQSPLREKFRTRLIDLRLHVKTHPYLENWAESFMKAKAYRSAKHTHSYFAALSRSARLADWQFDQALQSARILACDLLNLPWAQTYDWEPPALRPKTLTIPTADFSVSPSPSTIPTLPNPDPSHSRSRTTS
jgi:hypothetical protein